MIRIIFKINTLLIFLLSIYLFVDDLHNIHSERAYVCKILEVNHDFYEGYNGCTKEQYTAIVHVNELNKNT